jgi:flagellar biosynthesis/type III secretory pathway protein FliH
MIAVQQPYQELFDYLAKQLNIIALQTEMQEIEAIVMSNHEQQVKDAYNQGFRDGKEDFDILLFREGSKFANAQIYYDETFKK